MNTVTLEFTSALLIRCVAKVDMDAYGLKQGQVFYCAYSESESKAQGKNVYHVVVWNYTEMRWTCPCKAVCHNCKHVKAASRDCSQPHSAALQGYKPASKAEKFAALVAKYDVRNQPVATVGPCTAIVEAEKVVEQAQAARGSLASSSRHMEMAPSGRMVFMR